MAENGSLGINDGTPVVNTITDKTRPTEVLPEATIPVWIPDQIQDRMRKCDPRSWSSISHALDGNFSLDKFSDKFHELSGREKQRVLKTLGISDDDLARYNVVRNEVFYGNHKTDPTVLPRLDQEKKVLATKIWETTSPIWEKNRPKSEAQYARSERIKEAGNFRAANSMDRFYEGNDRFVEGVLGRRKGNDLLERVFAVPSGVESTFQSYGVLVDNK